MAERLTNRTHDGHAYLVNVKDDEQEVECKSKNTAQCILDSWERLAAYEDLGTVEELAALKERTADAWLQLRTATFSTNKGAADLAKFILSILPEAPNGAGKEQNDGK